MRLLRNTPGGWCGGQGRCERSLQLHTCLMLRHGWHLLTCLMLRNPPTRVGVTSILILCRVQNVVQNPNPKSKLRNQKSKIQNPKSKIRNPKSKIQNPKSKIRNPKSKIQNPKSKIRNPNSKIQNPKSKICTKRIAT